MPENNEARTDYLLKDIDVRIKREEQVLGINTESSVKPLLDKSNELIDSYIPVINGIDNKIVSIGQSINLLKDEIITLVETAVGTSTEVYCGIASTGPGGACGLSTDGGVDGGWAGGISTCLVGYSTEYYDTITTNIWGFSSTSYNPFTVTTGILTDASSTFGAGIGTYLFVTQDNLSYIAGYRVSLGSSDTCSATQTEIDRKDGKITTLRGEIGHYIGMVNKIREDRWKEELARWGQLRAQTLAGEERDRLVGILTAFTDSTYNSLFLR